MIRIEDIAMVIKSVSQKHLNESIGIELIQYEKDLSRYQFRRFTFCIEHLYIIDFMIKPVVDKDFLSSEIRDMISKYLNDKMYEFGEMTKFFSVYQIVLINENGDRVGVRGNVEHIEIHLTFTEYLKLDDDKFTCLNRIIRDLKLASLGI